MLLQASWCRFHFKYVPSVRWLYRDPVQCPSLKAFLRVILDKFLDSLFTLAMPVSCEGTLRYGLEGTYCVAIHRDRRGYAHLTVGQDI